MTDAGEIRAVVDEQAGMVAFKSPNERLSPQLLGQLHARSAKIMSLQQRLQDATNAAMLEHKYQVNTKAGAGDSLIEPSLADIGQAFGGQGDISAFGGTHVEDVGGIHAGDNAEDAMAVSP
jgi:hypothetical protein